MRQTFAEYYPLDPGQLHRLWSTATIVFDTSALLLLHRLPDEAREDFFKVVNLCGLRVWIPHHVALEYHRNLRSVISSQEKIYTSVSELLGQLESSTTTKLKDLLEKRHSVIRADGFVTKLNNLIAEFKKDIKTAELERPVLEQSAALTERLNLLLSTCLGKSFSSSDLESVTKDAARRIAHNLAPAGKVDSKKTERFLYEGGVYETAYGDCIIWAQILAEAKTRGWQELIFVTEDRKEEWWELNDRDEPVRARPELLEEARTSAGIELMKFHTMEDFLREGASNFNVNISSDSEQTISDVASTPPLSGTPDWSPLAKALAGAVPPQQETAIQRVLRELAEIDPIHFNMAPVSPLAAHLEILPELNTLNLASKLGALDVFAGPWKEEFKKLTNEYSEAARNLTRAMKLKD